MPQIVLLRNEMENLKMVQIKKYCSNNAARTIAANRYGQGENKDINQKYSIMKRNLLIILTVLFMSSCTTYKVFVPVNERADIPDGVQYIVLNENIDSVSKGVDEITDAIELIKNKLPKE
jgi:hypothetical protein